MVRRTSEEDEEEVVEDEQNCDRFSRILGVRNRYLEHLRETQVAWLTETQNERVREHRQFHALDHAPGVPHAPDPHIRMIKITGYCAICLGVLTTDFPKDYPEEWMFCCSCLGWARSIVEDKTNEWVVNALKSSTTVRKIYDRITLSSKEKAKWQKRNEEWRRMFNERKK